MAAMKVAMKADQMADYSVETMVPSTVDWKVAMTVGYLVVSMADKKGAPTAA